MTDPARPAPEDQPIVAAYLAMETALAKRILADRNAQREHPRDWPCGQTWDELGQTSHETFWSAARKEAGLPPESAFKNDVILAVPAPAPPGAPVTPKMEQAGGSSATERSGAIPAAPASPAPGCAACPVREAVERAISAPKTRPMLTDQGLVYVLDWVAQRLAETKADLTAALAQPCAGAPEPSEAAIQAANIRFLEKHGSYSDVYTSGVLTRRVGPVAYEHFRYIGGAPGGGPQERT